MIFINLQSSHNILFYAYCIWTKNISIEITAQNILFYLHLLSLHFPKSGLVYKKTWLFLRRCITAPPILTQWKHKKLKQGHKLFSHLFVIYYSSLPSMSQFWVWGPPVVQRSFRLTFKMYFACEQFRSEDPIHAKYIIFKIFASCLKVKRFHRGFLHQVMTNVM